VDELHLTKKDFKLEWYSGQGAGGQHRNKHQNCCRITHLATGITTNGTASKSRVTNQRDAFTTMARHILKYYEARAQEAKNAGTISTDVIRNYHAVRNEVHDKASGLKQSYKKVVIDGDLSEMIEARKMNMGDIDGD